MTNEKPSKSYAGYSKFLFVGVLVFCILYAFAWLFISYRLSSVIDATMSDLRGKGTEIACDNRSISGFPFRIGLFCDTIEIDDQIAGYSVAAGALRTTAVVYNPKLLIAELDAPVDIITPHAPPLVLRFKSARASIRPSQPLPERLSLLIDAPALQYRDLGGAPLAQAESAELHFRQSDQNHVDLASMMTGIVAFQSDRFSLNTDITWNDETSFGQAIQSGKVDALRGHDGAINAMTFAPDTGGSLHISGPLAIASNGAIDATLSITIKQAGKLAGFVQKLGFALGADVTPIINALNGAAMMGTDAPIIVTIQNSQARIGFIPLGSIPRF